MTAPMRIFGLAGWSGSGKTTLVARLLPELTGRGLTVSTLKHTHHNFDIDRPGKDSHNHRLAGAHEVMLASGKRWALMREFRDGAAEPSVQELAARMAPVDLLLVEGFKDHPHPKLEIFRTALGKPALYPDNPTIAAVAADVPPGELENTGGRLVFALGDIAGIADFVLETVGLGVGADAPSPPPVRAGFGHGAA
ncbi:MAG: molybdopterin-guanine dinucleotide biosynthesis protein B [Rhodospirillales bacterium]